MEIAEDIHRLYSVLRGEPWKVRCVTWF